MEDEKRFIDNTQQFLVSGSDHDDLLLQHRSAVEPTPNRDQIQWVT
jgi:hypothetical protein